MLTIYKRCSRTVTKSQLYRDSIIQFLQSAKQPIDVEKIRVACDIGNWQTALKHCLELQSEKRIQGTKTSKSWVFWGLKSKITNFANKKGGDQE